MKREYEVFRKDFPWKNIRKYGTRFIHLMGNFVYDEYNLYKFQLNGQKYFILPFSSNKEKKILRIADNLGLTPKILAKSKNYFLQEAAKGKHLKSRYSKEGQEKIGRLLGHTFGKLSLLGIEHGDLGKDHIFVSEDEDRLSLIDFGESTFTQYGGNEADFIPIHFNNMKTVIKSFDEVYSNYVIIGQIDKNQKRLRRLLKNKHVEAEVYKPEIRELVLQNR